MRIKTCTQCKIRKPLANFHRQKDHSDGRKSYCSQCGNKYLLRYYKKHREALKIRWRNYNHTESATINTRNYRLRHPEKYKAKNKAYNAYLSGKIKRENCELCGGKAQMHHDDYSKPLKVRWLCHKHHQEYHRQLRQFGNNLQTKMEVVSV